MEKKILVIGGANSGKSEFAESLIDNEKNLYIATSIEIDSEMKKKIEKHKVRRKDNWKTIEKYESFEDIEKYEEFKYCDNLFLDCITIMITNIMMDIISENEYKLEANDTKILQKVKKEIEILFNLSEKYSKNIIIVTNEIGMGVVPNDKLTRVFREIAGEVNKYLAQNCEEIYLVIAGIPNKIR